VDDAPAAHRLRPWTTRRYAAALPIAAAFAHMPTAFNELRKLKTTTTGRVTFLREATRRPRCLTLSSELPGNAVD
jgi:hypothetical protein